MPTRTRKPVSRANRFGMAVIAVVVALLITVLLLQSYGLKKKILSTDAANTQLQEQIAQEEGRAEELKTLPSYIESDEYIEKVAREKFGLVYEDEVIFRAGN